MQKALPVPIIIQKTVLLYKQEINLTHLFFSFVLYLRKFKWFTLNFKISDQNGSEPPYGINKESVKESGMA